MPFDVKAANLTLQINAGENADADELDRLTRQLLTEIKELEVESVELAKDETAPAGTKSIDAVTLGALAVAVLPTVVPKLIDLLQSWLMRGEGRAVKIKTQVGDRSVELEYSPKTVSPDELKSLVDKLSEALWERNKNG
jgi:hypothetical protein